MRHKWNTSIGTKFSVTWPRCEVWRALALDCSLARMKKDVVLLFGIVAAVVGLAPPHDQSVCAVGDMHGDIDHALKALRLCGACKKSPPLLSLAYASPAPGRRRGPTGRP